MPFQDNPNQQNYQQNIGGGAAGSGSPSPTPWEHRFGGQPGGPGGGSGSGNGGLGGGGMSAIPAAAAAWKLPGWIKGGAKWAMDKIPAGTGAKLAGYAGTAGQWAKTGLGAVGRTVAGPVNLGAAALNLGTSV